MALTVGSTLLKMLFRPLVAKTPKQGIHSGKKRSENNAYEVEI